MNRAPVFAYSMLFPGVLQDLTGGPRSPSRHRACCTDVPPVTSGAKPEAAPGRTRSLGDWLGKGCGALPRWAQRPGGAAHTARLGSASLADELRR